MKKLKKKQRNTIIFVLVILAVITLVVYFYPKKVETTSVGGQMISYIMYDKYGNVVKPHKVNSLSIVDDTPNIANLSFVVRISNIGSYELTCNEVSFAPALFNTNMVNTPVLTISPGTSGSWTSNSFPISSFESSNVSFRTNFNATVHCTYLGGIALPDLTGSLLVKIQPDVGGTASYTIETLKSQGATCGDGTCQSPDENITTCAEDCAPSMKVIFRTSSLTYGTSTAVAYNSTGTCGIALTQFGQTNSPSTLSGTCASNMPTSTNCGSASCGTVATLMVGNLPGGFRTGGASPSLWKCGNTCATRVAVCDDDGSNYGFVRYDSTDNIDKVKVDSGFLPNITSQEVSVPC